MIVLNRYMELSFKCSLLHNGCKSYSFSNSRKGAFFRAHVGCFHQYANCEEMLLVKTPQVFGRLIKPL
jgi:hypothetical protein